MVGINNTPDIPSCRWARNGREVYVIPPKRGFARTSTRWKNYTGRNKKSIVALIRWGWYQPFYSQITSTWFMIVSDLIRNKTIDWPIDFTLFLCKPESTFVKLSKMNIPTVITLMQLYFFKSCWLISAWTSYPEIVRCNNVSWDIIREFCILCPPTLLSTKYNSN